jgi:molybdopterin-containing oxidoreductase family iron-sulfur binding subunit
VQRLRNAEIEAQKRGVAEASRAGRAATWDDLRVRDGEVTTACAQACPTNAIVFGDGNDAASRVAALKKSELNYGLLEHLNTQPATTYLAALRNPNPNLA